MVVIADETVEGFNLPELSGATQNLVCFVRRVGLQRMLNIRKLNPGTGRSQEMHMIRHHHPGRQPVSLAIVKEQRVLYHRRHSRVLQITFAVALIEIGFNATAQRGVDINPRFFLKFYSPFIKHSLRQ